MTLTQNALVLHTTHQPAKPVETNNTSHVFAARTIKAKPLNKNNPFNVKASKKQGDFRKQNRFGFGHPKKGNNMCIHRQVVSEFVRKTPVTHLSHYEQCYCKKLPLASSSSNSIDNSNFC